MSTSMRPPTLAGHTATGDAITERLAYKKIHLQIQAALNRNGHCQFTFPVPVHKVNNQSK